jgi:hypothetical protein
MQLFEKDLLIFTMYLKQSHMTQIETTTKGFSKATKEQIVALLPNARTFKGCKIGYSLFVNIYDENKVKVAYWMEMRGNASRRSSNGIIRIL